MPLKDQLPRLSTLSDVLQVSQAALGALLFVIPLLGIVFTFLLGFPLVAVASLLSAAFVLGIIGCLVLLRRYRRGLKTDWNPFIWMRNWASTVRVLSATEVEYSNFLHLKILRDDVSRFNWRVGWTGEGILQPWVKNNGFRCELKPASIDPAQILIIHFDRPRSKGETFDLEFGIHTVGTSKPQEPFHSVTLFESRAPKSMRMRVEFADDLAIKSIQREIYGSERSPWPMEPPVSLLLDRNRFIEWPLKCRRGYRYGIRWELG